VTVGIPTFVKTSNMKSNDFTRPLKARVLAHSVSDTKNAKYSKFITYPDGTVIECCYNPNNKETTSNIVDTTSEILKGIDFQPEQGALFHLVPA
jgi:hypothetical protein